MTTNDWDPEMDRGGADRGRGLRSAGRVAEYDRLQRTNPVAWSERYGGYYTLTRYADVVAAALDTGRFRSGTPFLIMPDLGPQIPITLNPPEHTVFRRMLTRYFTGERMAALEPAIRAFAVGHIERLIDQGSADVVPELCQPLPAQALAVLMNLPDDAWRDLLDQFARLNATGWIPEEVNGVIFGVFHKHIAAVVAERRRNPLDPETDLISGALAMELDGQPLTDESAVLIGIQMIAAGHATTADSLGSAIHRLATNPDIQARLRSRPEDIPQAVEELLRIDAPLHELGRTTADEVVLHGRTIPAGCPVGLNFAAANRDPDAFPHPEAVIVDRRPNRHLTFGHGAHKCLGAPLARLEMTIVLEELLARTRDIDLAAAPESATNLMAGGFTTVPIRFGR